MTPDPFAPANNPRHPKNLTAAFRPSEESLDALQRQHELQRLHVTDHETGDPQESRIPDLAELERRQTLVDEFREQLATEGPDAEPPTLVDETGQTYVWHEGDRVDVAPEDDAGQPDGTTSSGWRHVPDAEENSTGDPGTPEPPRNGPGSDTDTWRAFAAQATGTEAAEWATMTRGEIIAELEQRGTIPSEQT